MRIGMFSFHMRIRCLAVHVSLNLARPLVYFSSSTIIFITVSNLTLSNTSTSEKKIEIIHTDNNNNGWL